jgi:hypothetical protein
MILTDEEVETRLESTDNLINRLSNRSIQHIAKRETDNPGHLGNRIRELIGHVANNGPESQQAIADTFGVGKATVNHASRGLIGNRLDSDLAEKVRAREDKQDTAHDEALDLMVNCITGIKKKLIDDTNIKPEKLSRIASDMSKIVGIIRGENDTKTPRMNVIIYKPEVKNEKDYDYIDA